MAATVWDIPSSTESMPAIDQAAAERLGKPASFWLVVLSLAIVFGLAVSTMLVVGEAGLSDLGLYAAIGLAVLVPYLLWIWFLNRFDRWTPRAGGLLFLAAIWGCLPAILAAIIMETELGALVSALGQADLGLMVIAPFSEELTKGLFVVLVYIFARRRLRGPWDGVFLGAFVGAGFGFAEDIGYLADAFGRNGVTGLALNYILREVFTAHAHMVFTAVTGLAAGLAARHGLPNGRALLWIGLGFLCAFALHAAWDTSTALVPADDTVVMLIAPLAQGVICAIIAIAGLRILRRRENAVRKDRLAEYVTAGWLKAEETAWTKDISAEKHAAAQARRSPTQRRRGIRAFYAVQSLLALNRQRALSGAGATETEAEDARLRSLLAPARALSAE